MADKKRFATLERIAAGFNAANPVGCRVVVRLDNGDCMKTVTRSPAWVIESGAILVSVVGISGGYLVDRITPLPDRTTANV